MKINRSSLINTLETVSPGLAAKDIVEQSTCYVFRGNGTVMTFNDEIACTMNTPDGLEIEGAVVAQPLLDLLRKMPDETVDVEMADGVLVVKGAGRRGEIRMETEILLPIESVEVPDTWAAIADDLLEALSIVQNCAATGKDDSFCLTCVHVTPVHVEACDNFQMARFRIDTGLTEKTLIRSSSIKHVVGLDMAEQAETNTWLHFRNGTGLVLSCRRYRDRFPDLDALLVVHHSARAMLPPGISDAVSRAEIFSGENTENNQVEVQLKANKVQVTGTGASGRFLERRDIKYGGPAVRFMIAPKLLTQLVERHKEVQISATRLMVESGKFKYVTCLSEAK